MYDPDRVLHLNVRTGPDFKFSAPLTLEKSKTAPSFEMVVLSQKPKPFENNGQWVWWAYIYSRKGTEEKMAG